MNLRLLPVLVLALSARPALAQVGHDPTHSPYRTLRYGQFIGASTGYFNGTGGQIGVAPHHGMMVGLRYDFLGSATVSLGLQGSFGHLDRLIINPAKPIETAATGPVSQSLAVVEAIFQFNLTGGKTWHGIAPFVGSGFGVALAGTTPDDKTDFKFRSKLTITPGLGARIFLSERLFLRVEARSIFWQISYPNSFRATPSTDPTKPPVIPGSGKEWSTSGWYSVGLNYAFHRPF